MVSASLLVLVLAVAVLVVQAISSSAGNDVAAVSSYTPVAQPTSDPLVYFTGDSVVQGYGAERNTDQSFRGFDVQVSAELNWRRRNDGRGGTGYVVAGNAEQIAGGNMALSDPRRIEAIVKARPSIVIIATGRNDYGVKEETLRAAVGTALDAIRNGLPQSKIYIVGPWLWTPLPDEQKFIPQVMAAREVIREEAASRDIPFIDGVDALGEDAMNMVIDDGFHPNQAGYDRISDVILRGLVDAGVVVGEHR